MNKIMKNKMIIIIILLIIIKMLMTKNLMMKIMYIHLNLYLKDFGKIVFNKENEDCFYNRKLEKQSILNGKKF